MTERIAWTLAHFLWEGALIGALSAVTLRMLARRSASARYAVSVAALMLMACAAAASFVFYTQAGRAVRALIQFAIRMIDPAVLLHPSFHVLDTHVSREWMHWVVFAWFAGAAVSTVRFLTGWHLTRRLVRLASEAVPPEVRILFETIRERLAFTRPVRLLVSSHIDGPAAVGWLHPVVLLPIAAITELSVDQVRAVLAHELAHIRRHDFIVNVLQRCVESLLFYHPAVWWLSRRIRMEREHCCDDLAVQVCGDPVVYARALMELERVRANVPLMAMAAGGGVKQRIRRLFGWNTESHDWREAMTAAVFVLTVLAAGVWQTATLQAKPPIPLAPAVVARPAEAGLSHVLATALTALVAEPLPPATVMQQAVPQPPTPSPTPQANAKAHIEGVVMDGVTGKPLDGVSMYGAGITMPQYTDKDGHFSLDVSTGSQALTMTKSGYRPGQPEGRRVLGNFRTYSINFVSGQRLEGMVIPMFPPSSMTGKVFNDQGQPMQDAEVVPFRYVYNEAGTRYRSNIRSIRNTNDLGAFQAEGLDAGDYYVEIHPSNLNGADGGILPPIYYPGTTDISKAEPVHLEGGGRIQLRNITATSIRGGRLLVRVTNQTGELPRQPGIYSISVFPRGETATSVRFQTIAADQIVDLGRFLPGSYYVVANFGVSPPGLNEARKFVDLTDADTQIDLPIVKVLPGTVVARAILESGTSDLRSLAGIQLAFYETAPNLLSVQGVTPGNLPLPILTSQPDGTFPSKTLQSSMPPYSYRVKVLNPPPGLYVRAIRNGSSDLNTEEFRPDPGNETNITVVLGQDAGTIQGSVADAKGNIVRGGIVALIPDDAKSAPRLVEATADMKGAFMLQAGPGEYHLYAWREMTGAAYLNPDFMKTFAGRGTAVHIDSNAPMKMNVQILEP